VGFTSAAPSGLPHPSGGNGPGTAPWRGRPRYPTHVVAGVGPPDVGSQSPVSGPRVDAILRGIAASEARSRVVVRAVAVVTAGDAAATWATAVPHSGRSICTQWGTSACLVGDDDRWARRQRYLVVRVSGARPMACTRRNTPLARPAGIARSRSVPIRAGTARETAAGMGGKLLIFIVVSFTAFYGS
jgi:hypothetical protein